MDPTESATQWVVRQIHPTRRRAGVVVGILLALLVAFLMYELGQNSAGYNRQGVMTRYNELTEQYNELKSEHESLKQSLAQAKASNTVDELAYQGVEDTLIALRDKVQAQAEELEFYRGIVSPGNSERGLRVQDLTVTPNAAPGQYALNLVLARSGGRQKTVSGSVKLSIAGEKNGEQVIMSLGDVAVGEVSTKFKFAYYQSYEHQLQLPEDFVPQTVSVVLKSTGSSKPSVEREFAWPVFE